MVVKILMTTGSLEWNLPERVTHRAGDVLTITFRITNPTASPRSYQIFMALFDPGTGSVITGTTGPISIEGVNTFEVGAEGELTLVAPLKIDYSNALVQAALYDVESGEMAVGLQSVLEEPPGLGEQIAPITGFASGVLVLGLVSGMVTGMMSDRGR
jgi:hypothetical protein